MSSAGTEAAEPVIPGDEGDNLELPELRSAVGGQSEKFGDEYMAAYERYLDEARRVTAMISSCVVSADDEHGEEFHLWLGGPGGERKATIYRYKFNADVADSSRTFMGAEDVWTPEGQDRFEREFLGGEVSGDLVAEWVSGTETNSKDFFAEGIKAEFDTEATTDDYARRDAWIMAGAEAAVQRIRFLGQLLLERSLPSES